MILGLVLIPFLAGAAGFFIAADSTRRRLLLSAAGGHLVLSIFLVGGADRAAFGGWLTLDPLGKIFLATTSILFFAATVYALGYLRTESRAGEEVIITGGEILPAFNDTAEAVFTGCFLFFLGTMSLVITAGHLGLLWVATEATTLASAPLIYYHRHRRSLEATWKYLLICSVGIALALLGTLFLAVAYLHAGEHGLSLLVKDLVRSENHPDVLWLKAAFLFLVVGYGTKIGLAPLHTWLPDAHSEAPSFVSALLSGALLNCAFLGLLRVNQVCTAAGLGGFTREIFILFGLASMLVAAVFIVRQQDYKRMLAYSTIEHMGIISVGVGLGGLGTFGALLHVINHSFTKGALFLTAGNILLIYKTKSVDAVHALMRSAPASGVLWLLGFLAITGSPPAGTFMSELVVLRAALEQGHWATVVIFLGALLWIFVSMASIVIEMTFGAVRETEATAVGEDVDTVARQAPLPLPSGEKAGVRVRAGGRKFQGQCTSAVIPAAVLLALVFILGVAIPAGLATAIQQAVIILEVKR